VTAGEKSQLHVATGADAVEMESKAIREVCRAANVPAATIRVISDAANEDLPLDFNALMTQEGRISWWRFARNVAARPLVLGPLLRFQRTTRAAAARLGDVLGQVVRTTGGSFQEVP
jgi:hypothetical protein